MALAQDTPTGSETIKMPRVDPRTMRRSAQVPSLEAGAHLAIQEDGGTVVVPIAEGTTKVGRGFSADIRLEDPTVSRRHAILLREGAVTELLDDRSANGVSVNGERVQRAKLRDGDVIVMGRLTMRYVEVPA
ncbi:FHA domain-containing protein [Conexibacter sp. SYSU D00693]|uniref:FHA domain-containing protein n=1 Tax=Conexibacter sp. SYSU D00693 TaxID=2812560 RepID=UPI00196A296D|nr:FHA domain-containing protein [Conexibacter sp. SYSU D00693]